MMKSSAEPLGQSFYHFMMENGWFKNIVFRIAIGCKSIGYADENTVFALNGYRIGAGTIIKIFHSKVKCAKGFDINKIDC